MFCKSAQKTKSMQWSNLPVELCEEIMGRLYFSDEVRFRAVCKTWHCSQDKERLADSLAWLITLPMISQNKFECRLYEPLSPHLNPYAVDEIILYNIVTRSATSRDIDVTYKYGCILFSISRTDSTTTNFLLFSILSKKVMTLPVLYHPEDYNHNCIKAFSANPSSRKCVFLVLQFTSTNKYTISTLRYGEKKWNTRDFNGRQFSSSVGSTGVYIRGIFYFVSHVGEVAAYNVAAEEWMSLFLYGDSYLRQAPVCMMKEVLQLDGNLVAVSYHSNYNDTGLCCIRKLELRNQYWGPLQSLGNRALFVSPNSFSVSTVGEEARNNGVLANHIYCLTSQGCIVYTLENGNMVKSSSGLMNWNSGEKYKKFWFEPPEHLLKHKQTRNKIKRNWGRKRNRSMRRLK